MKLQDGVFRFLLLLMCNTVKLAAAALTVFVHVHPCVTTCLFKRSEVRFLVQTWPIKI